MKRSEYRGLRTADGKLYIEYPSGGGYYDLGRDYYGLDNAHPTADPALRKEFSAKLAAIKD